jgi:hypothetical protein
MITLPDLETALLDLHHELRDTDIKLIVGGGYGIYLKTGYVRNRGLRTLVEEWPESRSTGDLDLFLRPELLIDSDKLKPLADAITKLGYQVIPEAQYFQFVKPGLYGVGAGAVKIDLLTGPRSCFEDTRVKADDRRARPTPSVGIHAHPVEEALTLEDGLRPVELDGKLSSGEPWHAEVCLPHPFTFLMMKIFAFRDRLEDADKEYGRYHALDLYTIVATTTEEEWTYALNLREQHGEHPIIIEAASLVSEHFSNTERRGMIRLRESPYYRPELQITEFMSTLQELFPEPFSFNER